MLGYRLVREVEYQEIKKALSQGIRPIDPELKKMAYIAEAATHKFFDELHPELRGEFLCVLRRTK
jgi:hypothetical protein